jgi:hypothetical protein
MRRRHRRHFIAITIAVAEISIAVAVAVAYSIAVTVITIYALIRHRRHRCIVSPSCRPSPYHSVASPLCITVIKLTSPKTSPS